MHPCWPLWLWLHATRAATKALLRRLATLPPLRLRLLLLRTQALLLARLLPLQATLLRALLLRRALLPLLRTLLLRQLLRLRAQASKSYCRQGNKKTGLWPVFLFSGSDFSIAAPGVAHLGHELRRQDPRLGRMSVALAPLPQRITLRYRASQSPHPESQ